MQNGYTGFAQRARQEIVVHHLMKGAGPHKHEEQTVIGFLMRELWHLQRHHRPGVCEAVQCVWNATWAGSCTRLILSLATCQDPTEVAREVDECMHFQPAAS